MANGALKLYKENAKMYDNEIGNAVGKLLADQAINNDRDYTYFHPSAIGGCPRQTALKMLDTAPTNVDYSLTTMLKFNNGHGVHARWQEYFRDSGLLATETIVDIKTRPSVVSGKKKDKMVITGESGREYPFRMKDYLWIKGKCKGPNSFSDIQDAKVGDVFYLTETPFEYEKWHMGGNIDAILDINGEQYICDIKTINDKGFWYLFFDKESGQSYPNASKCHICSAYLNGFGSSMSKHLLKEHASYAAPQKKHIIQLSAYMHVMSESGPEISNAVVLYENKDTQMTVETPFIKDDYVVGQLDSLCENLWDLIQKRQYPAIPSWASPKEFDCIFCEYKTFCWAEAAYEMDKETKDSKPKAPKKMKGW